jgi:hypothetical protein
VPRAGCAYFLDIDLGSGDSVWLRELWEAERGAAAGAPQSQETAGADAVDSKPFFLFQQPRDDLPVTLAVESLHYECVPHSTSVQIYAVVRNCAQRTVAYNAQLCAHRFCSGQEQQWLCPLTTVSGRIDSLAPGLSACVSALVRVPVDVFVRCQREYVQFAVALVWREESGEEEKESVAAAKAVAVLNSLVATK